MISGFDDAGKDRAEFLVVVEKFQERRISCPLQADTENVFGGRIEIEDEQVRIEQDHAAAQAFEDCERIANPITAARATGRPLAA